jgi:hypothetical protein
MNLSGRIVMCGPLTWSARLVRAEDQSIVPLVEGRIFMRGTDGVYCYDLRKPQGESK